MAFSYNGEFSGGRPRGGVPQDQLQGDPAIQPQQQQATQPQQYARGWTPGSKAELQAYAAQQGWSEDFDRFDENTVMQWVRENWDPNALMFRSEKTDKAGNVLSGHVEKPVDTPAGWVAWGNYAIPEAEARAAQQGGAAGGGSMGGGSAGGASGGSFNLPFPEFKAPDWSEVLRDPGYQFRLNQGTDAIQKSAAARGSLRTGGTLKDLADYSQGLASQEYQNAWNRSLGGWQANAAPALSAWSTRFGGDLDRWRTQYGGNLQRDLQREGNIFNLLYGGSTPPSMGF